MVTKRKVLVYVLSHGFLLVNTHVEYSDVGVQVPAGTIEHNPKSFPRIIDLYTFEASWDESLHERTVVLFEEDEIARSDFEYAISNGELDKGIRLKYTWLTITEAQDQLAAGFGRSLKNVLTTDH